ncbi:putative transporter, partial [Trabulsiella guamensis ATCC 49490]
LGGEVDNSGSVTANGTAIYVGAGDQGQTSTITNSGSVLATDGHAAIDLAVGELDLVGSGLGSIEAQGTAHGVLIGNNATRLGVKDAHIIVNAAGATGNAIENAGNLTNLQLTNTTIDVADGAGVRTSVTIDKTNSGTINVSGAGTGIAFENADGSATTGNLDLSGSSGLTINVSGAGGTGINANTSGTVDTAVNVNVTSASGGSALKLGSGVTAATNSGTLESASTTAPTVDAANATNFTNTASGVITASASGNAALAMGADDATVDNAGTINGNVAMNGANGTVTNTGTISADIVTTSGDNTITVDGGTVGGNIALNGSGTNTVLLENGATASTVGGSAGNDTVTIQGNGNTFTALNGGSGTSTAVFDGVTDGYHLDGATSDILNYDQVDLRNGSIVSLDNGHTLGGKPAGGAAVDIDQASVLEVLGSAARTLANQLTGTGTVKVDNGGSTFDFASTTGDAFAGILDLNNALLSLGGVNTTALTNATLKADSGSTTTVADGEQAIGGLTFAGGSLIFNGTAPDEKVATSHITAGKLDASGSGNVQINIPDPYVPGHETSTTSSLMTQDDANVGLQLVSSGNVTGSGGNLVLKDQNGNTITAATQVDIAQDGNVVAKGTYDYRLTTTGESGSDDGLYVNYGLTELDIQKDQTLTLAGDPGATGNAADMSARITGSGNLATNAGSGELVSLSNSSNDYTGDTTVLSGTLRTDADNALGKTAKLDVKGDATADLNKTTQSVGSLDVEQNGTLALNDGTLNVAQGGNVTGEMTGGGQLNVNGGTLTVENANNSMTADTAIASGATVLLKDIAGLGSGAVADAGTLILDAVTGALKNAVSGQGVVALENGSDVTATGENGQFAGTFDVQDGTRLHASAEKNLGTATVDTNSDGILSLDDYTGNLISAVTGTGTIALTGSSDVTATEKNSQFAGTYDVQSGNTLHVTDETLPSAAVLNDNGLIDLTTSGSYALKNELLGAGVLKVDASGGDFDFSSSTGNAFTGTLDLNNANLLLGGVNTTTLTNATLKADSGSTTTVADGEQAIGGLTFAGGSLVFNGIAPDEKIASGYVKAGKLDASGDGTVQIKIPDPYVPRPETATASSLMTQDDSDVVLQLVSAGEVTGSGGNLQLVDQNGNTVSAATQVNIAQDGDVVAKGTYDYRLTTAGESGSQDGLYVNYGLKELDLQKDKTLTLAGDPGATGAAADMSARITGSGNLATDAGKDELVSLSNSSNDYTGDTTVLSGTLRTDADNALGKTAKLDVKGDATADLNKTTQSVGSLEVEQNGTLALNDGTLNVAQGGSVKGEMTGGGQLNVNGGTLTVDSKNEAMTAGTAIASGASVILTGADTTLGGKGASDVKVASGGTLGGQGTVGGKVVNAGTVSALNALKGHESAPASTLTLAGGLVNSGTVNLAGSKTGNTLVVKGDYTGQNGKIVLNTYLGGDSSATDRVVIDGGKASGKSDLVVRHAGGEGANTTRGIRLVETRNGATTDAGAFSLSSASDGYRGGVIAMGPYNYRLLRGGTGGVADDWYLVSPASTPGGKDHYRPEVGAYLGNRQFADTMQVHTLFDRQGPARLLAGENGEPERASWARLTGKVAEMDGAGGKRHDRQTLLHIGSDVLRVPVGEGSFRAGVMGMVGDDHNQIDGKEGSAAGSVRGYSGGLYGTWYGSHDPLSGPYVDIWSMYGKFDNKVYGGGLPEEKYHSHNWTSSVEAGYGIDVSRDEKGNRSGLVPQVQVVHSSYHSGKHREKGNTMVSGMDDTSVTT